MQPKQQGTTVHATEYVIIQSRRIQDAVTSNERKAEIELSLQVLYRMRHYSDATRGRFNRGALSVHLNDAYTTIIGAPSWDNSFYLWNFDTPLPCGIRHIRLSPEVFLWQTPRRKKDGRLSASLVVREVCPEAVPTERPDQNVGDIGYGHTLEPYNVLMRQSETGVSVFATIPSWGRVT